MAAGSQHRRQNSEPSPAVVIDSPDHAATLLSQLSVLRTDRASSDTVLVAGGNTEVLCHRAVLAASSPYFRAMFHSTLRESREQRIKLDGVTSLALRRLVDYIYTGRIEVSFTSSSFSRRVTIGCFTDFVVTLDTHYITSSHHPPRHHNTTTFAVHPHITDTLARTGHLTDGNFITRLLYKDCY